MTPFRKRRGSALAGGALGLGVLAFALILLDSDRMGAERLPKRRGWPRLARARIN